MNFLRTWLIRSCWASWRDCARPSSNMPRNSLCCYEKKNITRSVKKFRKNMGHTWYSVSPVISFLANVNVNVHVRYMSSSVRLSSVCLSVCRLSVCNVRAPYSGDWNFRQYLYTPLGTLAICWHPDKILRRLSQGNPSVGGVKHKRGSRI